MQRLHHGVLVLQVPTVHSAAHFSGNARYSHPPLASAAYSAPKSPTRVEAAKLMAVTQSPMLRRTDCSRGRQETWRDWELLGKDTQAHWIGPPNRYAEAWHSSTKWQCWIAHAKGDCLDQEATAVISMCHTSSGLGGCWPGTLAPQPRQPCAAGSGDRPSCWCLQPRGRGCP